MIAKLIERVATRAPAALMFRSILERILSADALNEIFRDNCDRQIESDILFSHLVEMLTPVITGASKSVNAVHQASDCAYSRQALYDKLKGVETPVSQALLRVTTEKLAAIRRSTSMKLPDVIKGYHTFVLDGKSYNATEHRLLEMRTDARAPLPGRAVAMLDMRYQMFVDVECDANAYRCERKIVTPLLERQLKAGALYIADRNFSDGILLEYFDRSQAYFIIRQHGVCPSWREIEGEAQVAKGTDELGQSVYEQRIEVRLADGRWIAVRRVTVELSTPTRNGTRVVHVLTNLPGKVRASQITTAYRQRWTIENCFGHLSRALNAEIRTLCYPGAAGLCFSLSLLLFNIMSLIRWLLLQHGQHSDRYQIDDVSYYYIADEICRTQFTFDEVIQREHWRLFSTMTSSEFASFLKKTAKQASLAQYRKHIRGPTKSKTKRKFNGTYHIATQRILELRK